MAKALTDTAEFYVISPENLLKIIRTGDWLLFANGLWPVFHGDYIATIREQATQAILQRHPELQEALKEDLGEACSARMKQIIQEAGGAVIHTDGDGAWDITPVDEDGFAITDGIKEMDCL